MADTKDNWLDEIELPLTLVRDYKSGDRIFLDLTHFPEAKQALTRRIEQEKLEFAISELQTINELAKKSHADGKGILEINNRITELQAALKKGGES